LLEYEGLKITWLGHSSFRISNGKVVYIDPFEIGHSIPADIILITHEHFDHCSSEDVAKLIKSNTMIVTTIQAKDKLRMINAEILTVNPGKSYSIDGVNIEAVPAYNTNKFRSPGVPYHPKKDGKVGFIVTINGKRIYHAGDTDLIPEMKDIENIDIALLPISGKYVMTVEEAAEAADLISPKIAIPMHIGRIVGEEKDAYKFEKLADVEVAILEKGK